VVNPDAGTDLRRVVAPAALVSDREKIGAVRRLLAVLAARGAGPVWAMPDHGQIVARAASGIAGLRLEWLPVACRGTAEDTRQAIEAARAAGVGLIVAWGGDGTHRVVAQAAGEVPLLPLSTGTNNVFPYRLDGTVAGLAAALVSMGAVDMEPHLVRRPQLIVVREGAPADTALVDVVLTDHRFVAGRALWEWERWRAAVVLDPSPGSVGVAAVAAAVPGPANAMGFRIQFGPNGRRVWAPITPGHLEPVGVEAVDPLVAGETVALGHGPGAVALDGERMWALAPMQSLAVRVEPSGPRVLDVASVLREGRRIGAWIA
jgi:hypothetical protein